MSDRTCSVPGCGRVESLRRTWCNVHYQRWQRHGDPLRTDVYRDPRGMTPAQRVLARVLATENGCLLWQGSKSSDGYGRIRVDGGSRQCHTLTYEAKYGAVPDGLELDHYVCDTPSCVNPDHVRPSTHRENILRGSGFAAINAAKTTCLRGHPFDRGRVDGGRRCRTCDRASQRARYARRRALASA